MRITDILFEDYEGFPNARFELKAGGEVVLTFRVEGFERQPGRSGETGLPEDTVSLRYTVELRDPNGVLVLPVKEGEVNTTLALQDDKWRPLIRYTARIPASASSGSYPITIRVNDVIGRQQAEQRTSFRVIGEAVPASDTLAAQQIEYARSEQGPWTPQRYFALREPIMVRYKVVGFKVSPEGEVWLEEDWSVLAPDGEEVVSQQNAKSERQKSFYPPRFLPTEFSLTLKDPKPGRYTLRIVLRDRIGAQTATADSTFFLRP